MAKLSRMQPKMQGLKPRLSITTTSEQQRDAHRSEANAWRAWYKTAKWQRLRLRVLVRDCYICQRTGVILSGKYPAPNSPVVDHKRPHRGSETLFWDENNLHAVSKAFHDSEKQREEQADIKGVWY